MTKLEWHTAPEEIVFHVLHFVDDNDISDLRLQTDWVLRTYGSPVMTRVRCDMKPGGQAVRQVCANWRLTAIAAKKFYPVWMKSIHYVQSNISSSPWGSMESIKKWIREQQHSDGTDFAIWASIGDSQILRFFQEAVLAPIHSQVRFLQITIWDGIPREFIIQEDLPRLTAFAYREKDNSLFYERVPPISERPCIFSTMQSLVSLDSRYNHFSDNLVSERFFTQPISLSSPPRAAFRRRIS
jgi:hypothetical protein